MNQRLKTPNGTFITGTLETVPGEALIAYFEENGEPVYAGETKINWDDQKTVWREGSRVYLDEDGEEFTIDQLSWVQGTEDDVEEEVA